MIFFIFILFNQFNVSVYFYNYLIEIKYFDFFYIYKKNILIKKLVKIKG
jgi:hypothetical protein